MNMNSRNENIDKQIEEWIYFSFMLIIGIIKSIFLGLFEVFKHRFRVVFIGILVCFVAAAYFIKATYHLILSFNIGHLPVLIDKHIMLRIIPIFLAILFLIIVERKSKNLNCDFKKSEREIIKEVFETFQLEINIKKSYRKGNLKFIYFNSNLLYKKKDDISQEIAHRIKKKNIEIETSDNEEYDYMIVIKLETKHIDIDFLSAINQSNLSNHKIVLPIGLDSENHMIFEDLGMMEHVLIGGTTGCGKTNFIHTFLTANTYLKKNIDLFLIDIKRDLNMYKSSNINIKRCTDTKTALKMIDELIKEMENRNEEFEKYDFCSNIHDYHQITGNYTMKFIVVVIDEIAELLLNFESKERNLVEEQIQRLAQLGRSAGLRLVVATQKPNKEAVSTMIKANLYNRICFKVANSMESRIILDTNKGALIKKKGEIFYKSDNYQDFFKTIYLDKETHRKMLVKNFDL